MGHLVFFCARFRGHRGPQWLIADLSGSIGRRFCVLVRVLTGMGAKDMRRGVLWRTGYLFGFSVCLALPFFVWV